MSWTTAKSRRCSKVNTMKGDIPGPMGTPSITSSPPPTLKSPRWYRQRHYFLGYHSIFYRLVRTTLSLRGHALPGVAEPRSGTVCAGLPANEPFDALTPVGSHEISEAITDPIPQDRAGSDQQPGTPFAGENEIADKAVLRSHPSTFQAVRPFSESSFGSAGVERLLAFNRYGRTSTVRPRPSPPPASTALHQLPGRRRRCTAACRLVRRPRRRSGKPADYSVEVDWGDGRTSTTSGISRRPNSRSPGSATARSP